MKSLLPFVFLTLRLFLPLGAALAQNVQPAAAPDIVTVVTLTVRPTPQQECAIVHSTGEYRLERAVPGRPGTRQISETHLDAQDLQAVRAIIDQPEFMQLNTPPAGEIVFREKMYFIRIPRQVETQKYRIADETPPKAVQALLDWIK